MWYNGRICSAAIIGGSDSSRATPEHDSRVEDKVLRREMRWQFDEKHQHGFDGLAAPMAAFDAEESGAVVECSEDGYTRA